MTTRTRLIYGLVSLLTLSAGAQAPPKFKVTLQIGDGTRTAYHLGELVPAHITFTGTDHTKYWVGEPCEMTSDYPQPVPPQVLALRTDDFGFGCMGHGWGGDVDLTDHPYVSEVLLNRRYQLDTPGTFQLTWTGKPWGTAEITSPPVALTLLPSDSAWEAAELARADILLDHPLNPYQAGMNPCNILRFLDTPAAELDMARRVGQPRCSNAFDSPIRTAQHPAPVLAILHQRLQSPDEAISSNFLGVLAELSLRQTHPEAYAPFPRTFADQVNAHKLQLQELQRYEIVLAAALPQKTPINRASSIQSLLSLPTLDYPNPQTLPSPVALAIQQQMPAVFSRLSDIDQDTVLTKFWLDLASPAMEPVLVEIVSHPGYSNVRNTALRRLLQLNPVRGREFVLAALRDPYLQSFRPDTLTSLPDTALPDLDPILLQNAVNFAQHPDQSTRQNLHGAMSLLARYASPAIEPRIRALLNDPTLTLECGDRYDIFAYIHRVDAPTAEALFPTLNFAQGMGDLNFGPGSGYETCSLDLLARRYWSPAIEAAMLAKLNAPDPRDVSGALRGLQANASFYAQPTILAAFRRWHDTRQHKPIAATFQTYPAVDSQLDSHYLTTLLNAQSWLLFADAVNADAALCLNQVCRDQAAHYITTLENPNPILIVFNAHDGLTPTNFALGNSTIGDLQHLEQKIRQYPNGTAFMLDTRQQREPYVQQLVDTLGAWALAHDYRFSCYRETN